MKITTLAHIWARFFAALMTTEGYDDQITIKMVAKSADLMLEEFKERFPNFELEQLDYD